MSIEFKEQSAIAPRGTSIEEFETYCGLAAEMQRSCLWIIGDLALRAESEHPAYHNQVWPVWMSPDLIARCKAVSAAYTPNERNIDATWTVHMKHCKDPQRVALVQASVDAGQTSDEARKNPAPIPPDDPPAVTPIPVAETPVAMLPAESRKPVSNSYLLCIDISYYVQRMFPTHGASTAVEVCAWLVRVVKYLRDKKGISDAVVCFDGPNNHRKELTKDWKEGYKWKRTVKDDELVVQMNAIPHRLKEVNFLCATIDGMEADDLMASYVAKFDGKVTLMTADKDLRQCLSPKCNILKDVKWETSVETGELVRTFDFVVRKVAEDKPRKEHVFCHMTDGVKYGSQLVKGITPELWPHFQAIAGDPTDDIAGCVGIGGKGAMDLVLNHGTVQDVIAACKAGNAYVFDKHGNQKPLSDRLTQVVLDFEPIAETTLLLTTMRTDLDVPMTTKLALKEDV